MRTVAYKEDVASDRRRHILCSFRVQFRAFFKQIK